MMKSTIIKTIAVISLLLFLGGTAAAMHPVFQKADLNKDGKVDREELEMYMKKNAFEKLDTDGDTIISESEWSRADDVLELEEYKGALRGFDINKDTKITYPEFKNYLEKYSNIEDAFMLLDKDKDGGLAPDEISYIPSFRLITIHY